MRPALKINNFQWSPVQRIYVATTIHTYQNEYNHIYDIINYYKR